MGTENYSIEELKQLPVEIVFEKSEVLFEYCVENNFMKKNNKKDDDKLYVVDIDSLYKIPEEKYNKLLEKQKQRDN